MTTSLDDTGPESDFKFFAACGVEVGVQKLERQIFALGLLILPSA
jgi:hypothetical protein